MVPEMEATLQTAPAPSLLTATNGELPPTELVPTAAHTMLGELPVQLTLSKEPDAGAPVAYVAVQVAPDPSVLRPKNGAPLEFESCPAATQIALGVLPYNLLH